MIHSSDYAQHEMEKGLKAAWRASLPKLKRPDVDAAWARGRRREFLDGKLTEARRRLMDIRLERGKMSMRGDEHTAAFLGSFEADAAADVHQIQEKLSRLNVPEAEYHSRIPESMIQRAREVRMADLLGVDEKKKISCPFHGEDKNPSASISKGFFKCFTCGKGPVGAIAWLMEVEGCSFPAAVERLARL